MKQNVSDKEIIAMFQRYLGNNDPSEINKLKVEELVLAEARLRLNGTNPNFCEIIKNKTKDLELKEARKHESKIRAWNLVTGLFLGLTIAGVGAWLFNT
jgi:hypothetical protein